MVGASYEKDREWTPEISETAPASSSVVRTRDVRTMRSGCIPPADRGLSQNCALAGGDASRDYDDFAFPAIARSNPAKKRFALSPLQTGGSYTPQDTAIQDHHRVGIGGIGDGLGFINAFERPEQSSAVN